MPKKAEQSTRKIKIYKKKKSHCTICLKRFINMNKKVLMRCRVNDVSIQHKNCIYEGRGILYDEM